MDVQGLRAAPFHRLLAARSHAVEEDLLAVPAGFLACADQPYPYAAQDQRWGFDPGWINALLQRGAVRLSAFCANRGSETAILVGTAPLCSTPI